MPPERNAPGRRWPRLLGAVALVGILGVLGLNRGMALLSARWQRDIDATEAAMLRIALPCPPGTVERHEQIGGVGEAVWKRHCERDGKPHGPYEEWTLGRLSQSGTFVDGKEHGEWRVFDEDGNVARLLRYDHGKELTAR